MSTVTMEYLRTPHAGRRRPTLLVTAAIALLVLLGAGFAWWSDGVRSSANEQLVDALGRATARVTSGDRQVQGTLAYASPMIWSTAVPADVRAGLRTLVQDSAADVSADLGSVSETVAAVTVLPWQADQAVARDAVIGLLREQQQRFDRIATDATTIGDVLAQAPPSTRAALDSLRASGARDLPLR